MIAANGDVLHSTPSSAGDIWRAAATRKAPIEDWVRLAIDRQKAGAARRSSGLTRHVRTTPS